METHIHRNSCHMNEFNNSIIIYQPHADQPAIDVRLEGETVWLSQRQMSVLFDTSSDNVGLHLKNIYAERELLEEATTEDFSVVRQEGKRQVKRTLKHYNLDAIISVGYRISSKRAKNCFIRMWPVARRICCIS